MDLHLCQERVKISWPSLKANIAANRHSCLCIKIEGIRTRVLKTRALKDISPKNTIPNGHES